MVYEEGGFQNLLYLPGCLWSNQITSIKWPLSKKVAEANLKFLSFVVMRSYWGRRLTDCRKSSNLLPKYIYTHLLPLPHFCIATCWPYGFADGKNKRQGLAFSKMIRDCAHWGPEAVGCRIWAKGNLDGKTYKNICSICIPKAFPHIWGLKKTFERLRLHTRVRCLSKFSWKEGTGLGKMLENIRDRRRQKLTSSLIKHKECILYILIHFNLAFNKSWRTLNLLTSF